MPCFCSLFVILCALSSRLSAFSYRLDTKIGRTILCSAYSCIGCVWDGIIAFIPWFVRDIR